MHRAVSTFSRAVQRRLAPVQCVLRRSYTSSSDGVSSDSTQSSGGHVTFDSAAGLDLFHPSYFPGISNQPFSKEVCAVLHAPLNPDAVEIRPDGAIYLPEIEYRAILIKAFGAGGWGLVPRGSYQLVNGYVFREYALFCQGRYVSQAVGEMRCDDNGGVIGTSIEGARSNALTRCCKDVGIAAELWSPLFIAEWKAKYAAEIMTDVRGRSRKIWRRLDRGSNLLAAESATGGHAGVSTADNSFESSQKAVPVKEVSSAKPKTYMSAANFDPDAEVPAFFRKLSGRKWGEVLVDPEGRSYLEWAQANLKDPARQMAVTALEWAQRNL
ncbi:mitochondrial mitochondrial genome maintenance protein MGM101 [Andalucia godoyi]|uniref:Mitochondrial mitochondrial genome maintenance protein MGM101 n=1 Tax=Andalucia godoyi TaxID=505711 RepID=A0A8K0AHL2_ANDGO|nr:mitochondrial mitochondrial genome maintenance protein MGM101 [Andalucia godoyi]|eukprot:ANDGO_06999.mRNA.1 mitochondrial mitochondrial genome maintenance protein MGM101